MFEPGRGGDGEVREYGVSAGALKSS
jgi:hypothetical protein